MLNGGNTPLQLIQRIMSTMDDAFRHVYLFVHLRNERLIHYLHHCHCRRDSCSSSSSFDHSLMLLIHGTVTFISRFQYEYLNTPLTLLRC